MGVIYLAKESNLSSCTKWWKHRGPIITIKGCPNTQPSTKSNESIEVFLKKQDPAPIY